MPWPVQTLVGFPLNNVFTKKGQRKQSPQYQAQSTANICLKAKVLTLVCSISSQGLGRDTKRTYEEILDTNW